MVKRGSYGREEEEAGGVSTFEREFREMSSSEAGGAIAPPPSETTTLSPERCERLRGGSVRDCECKLPDEGGWLLCPPEARGILEPPPKAEQPSGDFCDVCGSTNMTRAGTCLVCRDCGSTSGGCS